MGRCLGPARSRAAPEACLSLENKKGTNPLKHTEVFCSITSRSLLSPSYYHSFGVTENHIVFLEQPFKLDILKMSTAYIRGANWASCLAFHKEDKVRPGWDPQPHEDGPGSRLTRRLACRSFPRELGWKLPCSLPRFISQSSREF